MLLNRAILALAKLAPDEESRYQCGCIEVRAEHSTVTDGHYLVNVASGELAHSEDSFPELAGAEHQKLASGAERAVLVSKTAALAALKAIRAMGKRLTMPILGHAALLTDSKLACNSLDSVQTFNSAVSGSFPNWPRVIPQGKPHAEVAVSAEYLEKLAAYFREHGNERGAHLRITVYDVQTAVRFDGVTADGQNIMALLMPVRIETCSFAKRPDQIEQPTEANTAEVQAAA